MVASTGRPRSPRDSRGLQGADGLVVAHVLIHRQAHARLLADLHGFHRLTVVERQRLLGQDAANVLAGRDLPHDFQLEMRRHRNVDDLNAGVVEHLREARSHSRNAAERSRMVRIRGRDRSNGRDFESRVSISDKLDIAHDEARTHCADAIGLLRRGR